MRFPFIKRVVRSKVLSRKGLTIVKILDHGHCVVCGTWFFHYRPSTKQRKGETLESPIASLNEIQFIIKKKNQSLDLKKLRVNLNSKLPKKKRLTFCQFIRGWFTVPFVVIDP